MSSERQSLLPTHDVENVEVEESEKWDLRERVGEYMESKRFHIIVLILVGCYL